MIARSPQRLLLALLYPVIAAQAEPGAATPCIAPGAIERAHESVEAVRCLVHAGRHGEALLAIERVLALDPGNEAARALRDAILASLETRPAAASSGERRFWISAMLGYDSNVAAGIDTVQISLPLFRNAIVDVEEKVGEFRRRASPVAGLGAGFDTEHALDRASTLRVAGLVAARYNSRAAGYLPYDYRLSVEVDRQFDALRPSLGFDIAERWVGQYAVEDRKTVLARLGVDSGRGLEVAPFAAAAQRKVLFLDDLPLRARSYGIEVSHRASALRVVLVEGSERSSDARDHLDRNYVGWRAAWSRRVAEAGIVHLSFGQTRSRYVEYSQLFLGHRVDRLQELQVALERQIAFQWFVMPQLVLQQNRSNITLAEYSRVQALVELRREF